MSKATNTEPGAVGSPVERVVRPYATSVTWRNDQGGSWQQWHDDDDPMPTEWDDRPPDEVVHVYTAAQVAAMLAAERERLCTSIKVADDKASEGDYMLDSDDCISVIRGTWNPGA